MIPILFGIACLSVSLIIYLRHHVHTLHEPPPNLLLAVDYVNRGIIPGELSGHIPMEYEDREDYTMRAELDRTFVDRTNRPMWAMRLVLNDNFTVSDQVVVFDLNGDLYQ